MDDLNKKEQNTTCFEDWLRIGFPTQLLNKNRKNEEQNDPSFLAFRGVTRFLAALSDFLRPALLRTGLLLRHPEDIPQALWSGEWCCYVGSLDVFSLWVEHGQVSTLQNNHGIPEMELEQIFHQSPPDHHSSRKAHCFGPLAHVVPLWLRRSFWTL